MSLPRNQIIKWLRTIDITDKIVLDVGCGPEKKWARNWTQGEPERYDTLDVNDEYQPTYCMDLNTMDVKSGGLFDVIFCIETFEHLWNPVHAAEMLARLLRGGGELFLTVPFLNPIHDRWDMLRYTAE